MITIDCSLFVPKVGGTMDRRQSLSNFSLARIVGLQRMGRRASSPEKGAPITSEREGFRKARHRLHSALLRTISSLSTYGNIIWGQYLC